MKASKNQKPKNFICLARLLLAVRIQGTATALSRVILDHLKRHTAESPADPMKTNSPKATVPVKKAPLTLQKVFDTWFLPVVFVAIGCVIAWAVWRHESNPPRRCLARSTTTRPWSLDSSRLPGL